jgi:hypothetical protein
MQKFKNVENDIVKMKLFSYQLNGSRSIERGRGSGENR